MSRLLSTVLTKFWDFIDTRGVIRRVVLFAAMWMTYWVSSKMVDFAFAALAAGKISDGNLTLLVTAIFAPIVGLGGYVFKAYLDSRSN